MNELLGKCSEIYRSAKCCHNNEEVCDCSPCLHDRFFGEETDTYDCTKRLSYYAMNYGPAFASEIYNYLEYSEILEEKYNGKRIKVLSLGCGFCPDYYALKKYIRDKSLDILFKYDGYDIESRWEEIREQLPNAECQVKDVNEGFSFKGYDIVFICKLYSTLQTSSSDGRFMENLKAEIENSMKKDSTMIFIDINHIQKGRDKFDNEMKELFARKRHYSYDIDGAYRGTYRKIKNTNNVFYIPANIAVEPKRSVSKVVIFEYVR